MRRILLRTVMSAAVSAAALWAQAPVIGSVVNYSNGDTRLSPGGFARLNGANLAVSFPPEVFVSGVKAKYFNLLTGDDAYSVHFDFEIPADLPIGAALVTVRTSAGISTPFPIVLSRYAPGLVYPSFTRSTSADATRVPFFNGTAGSELARPGEILTAYATGLGPVIKPVIKIGGEVAEVLESVLLPDRGIYRISFRVPQVQGVLPVVLTAGDESFVAAAIGVGSGPLVFGGGLIRTAPEAIVGEGRCGAGGSRGDPMNPPTTLAGLSVRVTDSLGFVRLAPILCTYGGGTSYVVPRGVANGLATVTSFSGEAAVSTGYLDVHPVVQAQPGFGPLFTGYLVRVRNGSQTVEASYGLCRNDWWCFSVDMGADGDDVFLVLVTTGVRHRSSVGNVKVLIGDVSIPVEYAGPQSEVAGLDQINVRLPRSLAGKGLVPMQIVVDGIPDNWFYSDSFLYADIL